MSQHTSNPNAASGASHGLSLSAQAQVPIPTTAPSSENNIRAQAPGWQFQGGNPGTFADVSKIVNSRIIDATKIFNNGLSPEYTALANKPSLSGIHPNVASNTVEGPASIVELARALKNDPQLIYEYVYNNIDWQAGWGVMKGATGALLDGSGNAFDQCMLLVALLRQAGYTANYVLGQIQMPVANYDSWFGTDSTGNSYCCYYYAQYANIPGTAPTWNGSAWIMVMSHVWVQVVVSGTTYVLDPSMKSYTVTAPLANLGTALGYNATNFLNDATSGATVDVSGNFVQNMNTTNIASDLTTMTSNLITYINNNTVGSAPAGTATVDDVLGGKAIVPVTLPFTWQTSLSYEMPGDVPTIWTGDVPLGYKTTLQVQYLQTSPGVFAIDQTFTSDQLAAGRLTLTFDGGLHPVLTLNGTVVQTSLTAQGAGTWNSAYLTVNHGAFSSQPYPPSWWQQYIYAGQFYLIGNAWGTLGRGQIDFHKTQLASVLANGASTAEAINGEYMSNIWFNWAAQASRIADLTNRLNKTYTNFFSQVGIVGLYFNAGIPTPTTDIGGVKGFSSTLNYDFTQPSRANTVVAMHGVALEAATLAQFNGVKPGVSTTTVIDKANRTAVVKLGGTVTVGNTLTLTVNDSALGGGTRSDTYTVVGGDTLTTIATGLAAAINADITLTNIGVTAISYGPIVLLSSTSVNQTSYTSSTSVGATETITIAWSKLYLANTSNWTAGININNILTTNGVDAGTISNIGGYINGSPNTPVLVPDQPSYALGGWNGDGYWALPPYTMTNGGGAFGLINNVAKGGSGQAAVASPPPSAADPSNYQFGQQTSADPIGLTTGDFFYNRNDISVGSQGFPFGLSFGRSYSSANQYSSGVLGWGWTHSHNLTAKVSSDGLLAMGDQFAAQGAATIAELYVSMDLGSDSTQPITKVVTMSLADKWWIDQLVNNTVAVALPTGTSVFVKQPNGTYTAPSNAPSTLTLVSGLYTLTSPQGVKINFNSSGQISSWVHPAGMTVTYTYSSGLLSTISNGLGRTLTLNYTSGKLTSVSDGNGRSVSYGFDGSGNLQTFTDATNNATTYQYDQPGRMTASFLPLNPATAVVTNVYDSLSRVKTQANARGQVWTYYFAGSRTEEVDALSNSSVRYFNRLGSVTRFINALGFKTDTQYDGLNRPIKTTLPEGNGAQATYDSNNHMLTSTFFAKPGSGLSNISVSNTFDPTWAKLKTSVDANGNTTTFNYDATNGNLLSVTRATIGGLTPKVTMKYNSRGQLVSAIDETGIQSQRTYDVSTEKLLTSIGNTNWTCAVGGTVTVGNVLTITVHDSGLSGGVRSDSYTVVGGDTLAKIATGLANAINADSTLAALGIVAYVNGGVVSLSTSPGNTTTFTGSTSGGATETLTFTAGKNITASFGYDAVGNAASITDPNGNQSTGVYDNERRPVQATGPNPFNFVSNIAYNVNGNVSSIQQQVTNGSFITASMTYTLTDKVSTTIDPVGRTTTVTYDGLDRVQTVTDAAGREVQYAYDALSRQSTFTDPSNTIASTSLYTNNGLPKSVKDGANNLTQFGYDGFDRPVLTTFADSSTAQITSYDSNGQVLTAVTRSGNTVTMTYDVLNRPSTKSPQGQATVTYGYDLANRLISASKPTVGGDPSTGTFQLAYDSAGRFYQEQYPDGKAVTHVLDSNGNRTKTTWPDGYFVTRSFDQLNRPTNLYLNGSGSPSLTYNYDQLSRRTSVVMGNGTSTSYSATLDGDLVGLTNNFVGSVNQYSLSYNNAHQVVGLAVSDSSYVWHPASAGTVTYGAADSVNKYPTVGGATLTYDGNKNLTFDGTWTYSFNTENQLLSATSGGTTASYVYDPAGRQAQKTVSGTVTRFIYDGLNLIATYDGSGNLVNRYVHGPGVDEPAIQVTTGGVVSFFHRDFQGSIVAISNNSGAVTNKYTYGPFGESSALSGTLFGYTGQRYDAETGLYYYKARYYSPTIGRFLQTDPIGYGGGDLNLYNYVGNDPINSRDPLGLYRIPFSSSGAYWSDVAIWGPGIANAYWYHDFSGFADTAYLGIAGMMPPSAGGTNSGAAASGGNKGGSSGSGDGGLLVGDIGGVGGSGSSSSFPVGDGGSSGNGPPPLRDDGGVNVTGFVDFWGWKFFDSPLAAANRALYIAWWENLGSRGRHDQVVKEFVNWLTISQHIPASNIFTEVTFNIWDGTTIRADVVVHDSHGWWVVEIKTSIMRNNVWIQDLSPGSDAWNAFTKNQKQGYPALNNGEPSVVSSAKLGNTLVVPQGVFTLNVGIGWSRFAKVT